jgi:holo-[acyl-carrier-protein] synthase
MARRLKLIWLLSLAPIDFFAIDCLIMIYGVGTDVCDVRRMAAATERHGERFAQRVLAPGELAVWRARTARHAARGHAYLATRFSAKESFSKAIGLGMRMPMTWRNCEVINLPSGQPAIVLHGELKAWFEAKGLRAHVSLTDEGDHASSFVVVERAPTEPDSR